jgi:hypothetical protein
MSQANGGKVAQETKNAPEKEPAIDDIRMRTYEFFIARVGAPADEVQDWLQAEGEFLPRSCSLASSVSVSSCPDGTSQRLSPVDVPHLIELWSIINEICANDKPYT